MLSWNIGSLFSSIGNKVKEKTKYNFTVMGQPGTDGTREKKNGKVELSVKTSRLALHLLIDEVQQQQKTIYLFYVETLVVINKSY